MDSLSQLKAGQITAVIAQLRLHYDAAVGKMGRDLHTFNHRVIAQLN